MPGQRRADNNSTAQSQWDQQVKYGEPWRIEYTQRMIRLHAASTTTDPAFMLYVTRNSFPDKIKCDKPGCSGGSFKWFFLSCTKYAEYILDLAPEALDALVLTCNDLGIEISTTVLTDLSTGGGQGSIKLVIPETHDAVKATVLRYCSAEGNEEEKGDQVGVPDGNQSVTGMYTIFTNKLCAMSQQLGELMATHLRCVTDIAAIHSLIGSNQSTLTETMGNRFALKQSLTDAKADLMEQINRVNDQSGEHATVQFVNLRLAGHDKLQSELVTQVKEVAYLKEWKLSATTRIEKLEELAIQNAAFVVETKVLISQQAAALEDSKQQLIKMEFHITKLKERISTSDNQGSAVEAPAPAPTISQSANLAAQVSHATFTPTSKKL